MLQLAATISAPTLAASGQGRANVELTYAVSETNTFLNKGRMTVDWGDGASETLGPSTLPISGTLVHSYPLGKYVIRVTAHNYQQPQPQSVQVNRQVTVVSNLRTQADAAAVLFGPILPQPSGSPSPSDWSFNLARDGAILSSSLIMLFFTRRGERVHDPEYGTRLHELIFDLSDDDVLGAVRSEVSRVVGQFEPRVEFIGVNVNFTDELRRTVQLQAEFVSRLSNQPLVIDLAFAA